MSVDRVSGYPDYTINKYIPVIFAGKTLEKFYASCTVPNISHTDYVGEVKNMGDTVLIRTVGDVPIRRYKKGMTLELDYVDSPYIPFTVNRANYYNFGIDDVDIKQMDLKMMDKYANDASMQMKIFHDTEVFADIYTQCDSANVGTNAGAKSASFNLGTTGSPLAPDKTTILDYIVDASTVLYEQNIPDNDRFIVLPPKIAGLIKKSELKNASITGDKVSVLRSGYIGDIDTFRLYISNLLPVIVDGSYLCTYCYFGHRSALAFVAQLTKTERYRPQRSFAEAMKGLVVYDYKVLQPKALGALYVRIK